MSRIENTQICRIEPLLSPASLKYQYPAPYGLVEHMVSTRQAVRDIMHANDQRLLVVVGPCSMHDPKACLDYAKRLTRLKDEHGDALLILMRVYFEKPRTTIGWKGFINDPLLNSSCDINTGVTEARRLLLDINAMGLGVATEFLDTITPQYIADLISWAAIGARTTESQAHRNLASGLSMPVGFKNGTTGNMQIAVDAIVAANSPHHFLSVTDHGMAAIVQTVGNPDCQIILRGGSDTGPNYDASYVEQALTLLEKKGRLPSVMVDCSHGNSSKDFKKQALVLESIKSQIAAGNKKLHGVMIESFIEQGNQPLDDPQQLVYGKSVTDACIGWDETQTLLADLAAHIRQVREL
jgi:3-deoxy-7-phosphoheptulonate synthase